MTSKLSYSCVFVAFGLFAFKVISASWFRVFLWCVVEKQSWNHVAESRANLTFLCFPRKYYPKKAYKKHHEFGFSAVRTAVNGLLSALFSECPPAILEKSFSVNVPCYCSKPYVYAGIFVYRIGCGFGAGLCGFLHLVGCCPYAFCTWFFTWTALLM